MDKRKTNKITLSVVGILVAVVAIVGVISVTIDNSKKNTANTQETAKAATNTANVTVSNSITKQIATGVYEYWFIPSERSDIRIKLYDKDGNEVRYLLNNGEMINGSARIRTGEAPASQGGTVSSFTYSVEGGEYSAKQQLSDKYESL